LTDPQTVKFTANESSAREAQHLCDTILAGPLRQAASNGIRVSVPVGFAFGEHVPGKDQQLASDGNNSSGSAPPLGDGFELLFPVVVVLNDNPCGFNHGCSQFFAPRFGDPAAPADIA
jgi:hypothetical protein